MQTWLSAQVHGPVLALAWGTRAATAKVLTMTVMDATKEAETGCRWPWVFAYHPVMTLIVIGTSQTMQTEELGQ